MDELYFIRDRPVTLTFMLWDKSYPAATIGFVPGTPPPLLMTLHADDKTFCGEALDCKTRAPVGEDELRAFLHESKGAVQAEVVFDGQWRVDRKTKLHVKFQDKVLMAGVMKEDNILTVIDRF